MLVKKQLHGLPNSKVRLLLTEPYFNEFEIYETRK
jgi:hypothetical protein